MFVSSDSEREPLVDPGLSDSSWVRLYPPGPVYLVQLDVFEEKSADTRVVLFGYIEQVEQMLMDKKTHGMTVRCVQVICPGGSQSPLEWVFHRLKEIWAIPTVGARRCVMADGTVIFTDVAGYIANPADWTLLTKC